MTKRKFSQEEIRKQETTKRSNQSLKPAKNGGKETRNDDGNNVQEGYDEQQYTSKEIRNAKRSTGK
ncbi:hypothetical protein [Chitinophaga silvatica]|nr:hypothetical protein [Chitinophaga silvatica]